MRLRERALEYAQSAQVLVDVKARSSRQTDRPGSSSASTTGYRKTVSRHRGVLPAHRTALALERAYTEHQSIVVGNIKRPSNTGEARYFEVQVTSLRDREKAIGASITFVDMTHYHELEAEVHRARQEAETANEELQSTDEELETTNEELQSTNEGAGDHE